jgi:hypothetical protein
VRNSKKGIFVVPRLVLIDQTIHHFEREGLSDLGVIQGNHPRRNLDARIQICSAQTLIRREIPQADVVIQDECFVGELTVLTPTGPKRIDEIKVGDKVLNATGVGTVKHVLQIQSHTIKLELSNGQSIRVTRDHPFFTDRGWVKAEALERGSNLFGPEELLALWQCVQTMGQQNIGEVVPSGIAMEEAGILLKILLEETRESNENLRGANEAEQHPPQNQTSADPARRQREALAASAISAIARFGGMAGWQK